jgi:hypothetical protein
MNMATIRLKDIISTLHADLIGKDSHRGITLTYGWLANQIGHYALGFIPTSLLFLNGFSLLNSMLYVGFFWLAFEIYNALSPLYKKEYKGNGTFKPHWSNLTFDTFTDLCFFWAGSATFYFCASTDKQGIWFFVGALVLLFFSIRFWFLTKLYQQNAFFPYQFRLSQWNGKIDDEAAETIRNFIKSKGSQHHHFIFMGAGKSGKTTVSVGIGNELAIRHKRSTYTTFSKWISSLNSTTEMIEDSSRSIWTWLNSDFLIVDDINPGSPAAANKYLSSDAELFINNIFHQRNIDALKGKSVAWVVGQCAPTDSAHKWKNMLINFGIAEENIHIIALGKKQ